MDQGTTTARGERVAGKWTTLEFGQIEFPVPPWVADYGGWTLGGGVLIGLCGYLFYASTLRDPGLSEVKTKIENAKNVLTVFAIVVGGGYFLFQAVFQKAWERMRRRHRGEIRSSKCIPT
jgi:hypothetical protein